MKTKVLLSCQSLVTNISDEVCDLASFLGIPFHVEIEDDHIYIEEPYLPLELMSYYTRRSTDVEVSSKVFCEILMDIMGGLTVLEAYNKQGYTF